MKSSLLLRLAGGWLILVCLGHTWGYYEAFVTRDLLDDSRLAAYELMKEPMDGGLVHPSFWTVLQMLALELTFFLAFAAALSLWVAGQPSPAIRRTFARIATITFGLASVAFVFVHPQINAAVIAIVAAVLFGTAWWRAASESDAGAVRAE
ncbi:MAG: hypothetical protein WBW88_05345 [Rhodothermales bacterium]